MTQEEFNKAPLLGQILYNETGMLVENHLSIAEAMEKYHQAKLKLLNISDVSGYLLMSEFWRESADLIEKYRDSGDERAAQGVVSCRILIDGLMKKLENDR